jgi:type IV secretory pathway VirB10-like protein
VNDAEIKGPITVYSRGLITNVHNLMTKSKMAIPIPRTEPFPKDTVCLLHLAKPGERNAAPRLNIHEESPTVTPALKSMQGRLIICRKERTKKTENTDQQTRGERAEGRTNTEEQNRRKEEEEKKTERKTGKKKPVERELQTNRNRDRNKEGEGLKNTNRENRAEEKNNQRENKRKEEQRGHRPIHHHLRLRSRLHR